jgi:hypothetical protein
MNELDAYELSKHSFAFRDIIGHNQQFTFYDAATKELLVGTNVPLALAGCNGFRANGKTGSFYDLLVNGTRYGELYADAANEVALLAVAGKGVRLQSNGSTATGWYVNSSGHLIALTDATFDIGASGATRPRNLYLSGTIISGGAVAGSNISAWASWTPTRTGWTDVGAAVVTARYCQIGNVIHFQVKIVPGVTTATTAGTSYISLPVSMGASSLAGDGSFMDNTTFISIGPCVFNPANSRCYVPTQAATGDTLTIAGWYEP